MRSAALALLCVICVACGGSKTPEPSPPPAPSAQNLVIITIDTLRADRIGAYGYRAARTPVIDALAHGGVRFTHAYATAPITLTSHASLMTGRYPAGHGARHNGMRLDLTTPGFVLKETPNLTPPIQWTAVTNAVVNSNGQFLVTLPASESNRFFQLVLQ